MTQPLFANHNDPTPGLGTAIQGTNIGLGIPLLSSKLESLQLPPLLKVGSGVGFGRRPYSTRHRSFTTSLGGYDSSPTPSSSFASTSSESDHGLTRSATHDALLSYFSPSLNEDEGEEKPQKRVYLLSDGLSNPQMGHRRCKSETFKFPLPPSKGSMAPMKGPLKSALRQRPEEESDEQARQGWSPYSSVAPTPRQGSSSHRTDLLSPTNEEHFASPRAKLARLHASFFLFDRSSELPLSLPDLHNDDPKKSLDVVGGSVEEQMAYLCGLGYRYGKKNGRKGRKTSADYVTAQEQHGESGWWSEDEAKKEGMVERKKVGGVHKAVRVISNAASAVSSLASSSILSGLFAAVEVEEDQGEGEGDITNLIRQQDILSSPQFEGLLGREYSYLLDESLHLEESIAPRSVAKAGQNGLMTPPLTTPELGLGSSPMLLESWPSPLRASSTKSFGLALSLPSPRQDRVEGIEGCRPYSTASSLDPFSFTPALSPPSTLANLSSSVSCPVSFCDPFNSTKPTLLEPSANEEGLEGPIKIAIASRKTLQPVSVSVLTRPRPLRSSNSNNSLFSSASSDKLQKPEPIASIIARGRPIPPREAANHKFGSKTTPLSARIAARGAMSKSCSTTTVTTKGRSLDERRAKAAAIAGTGFKVPQRKSSLDVRAQAQLHREAEAEAAVIHPNGICKDELAAEKYHSSASPYLLQRLQSGVEMWASAGTAAKQRRRGGMGVGGMPTSKSLPVLFTARMAAQRAKGETGVSGDKRKRKLVVSVGPDGEVSRVEPPK
ncbi:hypothetical protein NDA11_007546 [Ustilago hordei]|uniref:Uncharacterized protein n=1 Tax=Ustilago hordei TaxID=120017 RepID=I2G023_USTHO|nr:hypothetical protein NDA10_005316 [Ustilago hordei]KAJ1578926.1 hypothetical protein NDA15_002450 [Ustilago hordei]KAJ1580591.1 hypothetical protein NDA12_002484 [Ustilago hordei]KAJ1581649.1 hypothetical protein NDA11_007546 [Ustilago hordei]UTT92078.1 hypothetical protein NDA17_005516 [Ustilago hordei]